MAQSIKKQISQGLPAPDNYDIGFAPILRALLESSPKRPGKTTYKALSVFLDVKQQSVSLWASGATMPDSKHLAGIAEFFGVSCDYLLGREPNYTHAMTDICRETGLAPESVEVLRMGAKNMRMDKFFSKEKKTLDYYELKALNHLISNCNGVLTEIGLYLFAELEMPDRTPIKDTNINLATTDEYVRRGMLMSLEEKLMKYREMLVDGDLPLTLVLDMTRADRKAVFIKQRTEFLESKKGRPLTEEEIEQQGKLWEDSHGLEKGAKK